MHLSLRPRKDGSHHPLEGKKGGYARAWLIGLAATAVIGLVALRLALPSLLHAYVSRTIDHIPPDYHGAVGDIDVSLWRGAYQIHDLKLVRRDGAVSVPFFSADVVDLSVKWSGLFHEAFVGKATVRHPRINFVSNAGEEAGQTGISGSWTDSFAKLFPLKFDEIAIRQGEVFFHNFTSHPPVDLKLDRLEATALNLTNSRHLSSNRVTSIVADARLLESGRLHATVRSDVFIKPPSFDLALSVDDLPLPKLNDFFKAYANVTAASGNFDLYAEIHSDHGVFKGYLKPLLDHVKIIDLSKDTDPIHLVWESIVSVFVTAIKNQPKDRLATEIPLSGTVSDPHFGILAACGNILRNAFIGAFLPGFKDRPAAP